MRALPLALLLLTTPLFPLGAAPQITSTGFSVSPRIADISTGDTTVTARFRITDTQFGSRFAEGAIFVSRGFPAPATLISKTFSAEHRTSGDAKDGTYAIPLEIPDSAATGDWDIVFQIFAEGSVDGINDFRIRSLKITDAPDPSFAPPTVSNFSTDLTTVDPTGGLARVVTSFEVTDPDGVLPPILRLSFGSDAREFHLNDSHRIAGDATSATFRYAAWLPPGLPNGSYDWSVVAIDATGRTPDSIERVPAGSPALAVNNPGDAEFGFAANIGEPPFLDALTITPSSVDLSNPSPGLTGSLQFSDDASGFASATVFLVGATTPDRIELPLTPADITAGTTAGGTIDFAISLPPTSRAGAWTVGVDLADQAGNTTTYGGPAGDSLPLGAPDEIILSNPLPSPPAPATFTITGFRFSTRDINLTDNPATVGFELDMTDPDGSFRSATISATPFIAGAPQIVVATIDPTDLSTVDDNTLTFSTALHFPLGAIPGPWTVNVSATGDANSVAADIGNINITSFGNIDTTTPTLTAFTTDTPTIDITGAPSTAVFNLVLAGFAAPDTGILAFSNPSYPSLTVGPVTFTTAERTGGDDNVGTYTIKITFPAGTPTGTWYPHVTLTDPYLLTSTYGGTDPAAAPPFPAGIDDTVTVVDSGTPPYDAFIANYPDLADHSPTADPDRDNLPTLIELVLGTDPTVPDFPSPLQLTTTTTKLRLTFPVDRLALDTGSGAPITFTGQLSTTLRSKNPLPARSLSGGLYRLETDLTPAAPRFLNLRASQ